MSRRRARPSDGWKGWPERERRRIAWQEKQQRRVRLGPASIAVLLLLSVTTLWIWSWR